MKKNVQCQHNFIKIFPNHDQTLTFMYGYILNFYIIKTFKMYNSNLRTGAKHAMDWTSYHPVEDMHVSRH